MATSLRALILSITLLATMAGHAQCPFGPVDISVVPNMNSQLEIWLRPQLDFDGLFSSIDFTIQWPEGDGATLGTISQEMTPYFSLGASGPMHTNGGFRYQLYHGEGALGPLFAFDEFWTGGQEVLLTRINVNGSSYFQIVNDAFTNSVNGDFYLSLNGAQCMGEIYTFTTNTGMVSTEAGSDVIVSPNPTPGPVSIFVDMQENADLDLELLDTSGRRVMSSQRPGRQGKLEERIDLTGLADGLYMLQVRMGGKTSTHRIVLGNGTY
jgi:hypothetical protein